MLSDKEEAGQSANSLSTLQAVFRLMSAFATVYPKLGVSLGLPLENGFFANRPLTPLC